MTPEIVRLIRQIHSLSQREFAQKISISRQLLSAIENEKRAITEVTERKIRSSFAYDDSKILELLKIKEAIKQN